MPSMIKFKYLETNLNLLNGNKGEKRGFNYFPYSSIRS